MCEYSPLWTLSVGRVSWPPSRSQRSPVVGAGRGIPSPLYSASPSPSAHSGGLDSMQHGKCYGNETVIWVKGSFRTVFFLVGFECLEIVTMKSPMNKVTQIHIYFYLFIYYFFYTSFVQHQECTTRVKPPSHVANTTVV